MFINFNRNTGLSLNSYRNPSALAGDVSDILYAIENDGACITCDLEEAKDALEDDHYLSDMNITQETIEELRQFIVDNT